MNIIKEVPEYEWNYYKKIINKEYTQDEFYLMTLWELLRVKRYAILKHQKVIQRYAKDLFSGIGKPNKKRKTFELPPFTLSFYLLIQHCRNIFQDVPYEQLTERQKKAFVEEIGGSHGINGIDPAFPIRDLLKEKTPSIKVLPLDKADRILHTAKIDLKPIFSRPLENQLFILSADLRFAKSELCKAFSALITERTKRITKDNLKVTKEKYIKIKKKDALLSEIGSFNYQMFLLGMIALRLQYPNWPKTDLPLKTSQICRKCLSKEKHLSEKQRSAWGAKLRQWRLYAVDILKSVDKKIEELQSLSTKL